MRSPVRCERCGAPMRREGAHDKCDHCGWLTHCCEGDVCQPDPEPVRPAQPAIAQEPADGDPIAPTER